MLFVSVLRLIDRKRQKRQRTDNVSASGMVFEGILLLLFIYLFIVIIIVVVNLFLVCVMEWYFSSSSCYSLFGFLS